MSVDAAALAGQFGVLLIELLVLLFLVSGALALLARRVGVARLQRWMGGSRLAGSVKGMAVGFVVPFCTYSALPTVVAMLDARVRTATVAGFLLAAPVLDPLVLGVLWLLFGWQPTLAYAAVSVAVVFLLAVTADALRAERLLRPLRRQAGATVVAAGPVAPDEGCPPDPFGDDQPWQGLRPEARAAAGHAAGLLRRLAVPMVVAVAVAAAIVEFVPHQWLVRIAGPDSPFAVPAAALFGAPFYVSTEAFLPVASALHASGMALGATFAVVISAAGVNIPELLLLSRLMRPALLAAYTTAVISTAIAAGYLIPLLL